MHPILFKIGPLNIYSYGVMVALGFAIAAAFIYRRAPVYNLDGNMVVDYTIIILVSGVAGARLFYVLLNIGYYTANPFEIVNLSKGGLVWYGGFIGALAASAWFVRARKLDFWAVSDLVAPYLALAQALGRVGCFLNGCCYGKVAPAGAWAVAFPQDGTLRYPSQVYSAIGLLGIFVLLRLWQDRRRFTGEIFLGYCMLYAGKRFAIEFFRGDNPRIFASLTMSQAISIVIFTAAAAVFISRSNRWKKEISSGSK